MKAKLKQCQPVRFPFQIIKQVSIQTGKQFYISVISKKSRWPGATHLFRPICAVPNCRNSSRASNIFRFKYNKGEILDLLQHSACKPLYLNPDRRGRVDSSLPVQPEHSCEPQTSHTGLGMSSAAPQPSQKSEDQGFAVPRGSAPSPSLTGCFSTRAAGNADTAHKHPPARGYWAMTGWTSEDGPQGGTQRGAGEGQGSLGALQRAKGLLDWQDREMWHHWHDEACGKAVIWWLERGQVQTSTPWSFLLLHTGQKYDFFMSRYQIPK